MRARQLKSLLLLLAAALLYGCAPVISGESLSRAERDISFDEIRKDPGAYRGRVVILGGRVLRVENLVDRSTIEVLQMPLTRGLRPVDEERSKGRFIVTSKAFLDPAVYKGRLITVAGRIEGAKKRKLDGTTYRYVLLEDLEHYLWKTGRGRTSIGIGVGIGIHSD